MSYIGKCACVQPAATRGAIGSVVSAGLVRRLSSTDRSCAAEGCGFRRRAKTATRDISASVTVPRSPVDSCAFVPCHQVDECSLVGGCIHTRRLAPPDSRPSPVAYNPMTGTRLDLSVTTDDEPGVAEARWAAKRAAYLKTCR